MSEFVPAIALAFLLGSVLGGQILSRLRQIDLRSTGSGNIGATNALRAGGAKFALAVLGIDLGKGVLAVLFLPAIFADATSPSFEILPYACGVAAILGHIYSPWAGFSGGKGAATALGAAAVLLPTGTVFALLTFISSLILTGFVGLSMIFAHACLVVFTVFTAPDGGVSVATAYASMGLVLMIWTHRENLQRVMNGTENRFEKVMLFRRQKSSSNR